MTSWFPIFHDTLKINSFNFQTWFPVFTSFITIWSTISVSLTIDWKNSVSKKSNCYHVELCDPQLQSRQNADFPTCCVVQKNTTMLFKFTFALMIASVWFNAITNPSLICKVITKVSRETQQKFTLILGFLSAEQSIQITCGSHKFLKYSFQTR